MTKIQKRYSYFKNSSTGMKQDVSRINRNQKLKTGKMTRLMFLVCFFFPAFPLLAQVERKEIRDGNDKFEKGKYSDAETSYRKATDKNHESYPGNYNLGGALYRQDKYDEAIQQYQQSLGKTRDLKEQAETLYNMGNSLLQAKKYEDSINAYKQSLKINPDDNDARYNLAYAQSMLKQQQQQQQQDSQNKDDKQDKKDQKQQNSKDQKQQDPKNQQQDQQQDQQQPKKEQAQKQPKISKEDAERILQALKNDEQNLQEKLSRKEGERIKIEKNW
jgi:tetratricopeptide (TPR) repeat protein